MNRYPLWKYLLILAALVLGLIYAAPNLYLDDPSIQIAAGRNAILDDATLKRIETTLKDAGITYKQAAIEKNSATIRFENEKDQSAAKKLVGELLGNQYVVALNYAKSTPGWLTALNASPMYLGLDLRGGLHFLIEIDMETAIGQQLDRYKNDINNYVRKEKDKNLRALSTVVEKDSIEIKYQDEDTRERARSAFRSEIPDLDYSIYENGGYFYLKASINKQKLEEHRSNTITQIITVLKKRIDDKYQGLMEPVIVRQGDERIVAEFPGVQNSEELIDVITATASLEFRMENTQYTIAQAQEGKAPGAKLYTMREDKRPVLLKNKIVITGQEITHATAGSDQNGQPAVNVTLNSVGAKRMGDNTKENLGKRMGVVFIEYENNKVEKNGEIVNERRKIEEVISLATIQGVFSKKFEITGLGQDEATKLALLLRAGALAAPIQIVEERTVGPALGAENIAKGMNSVMLGFIVVVAFMLFWYRGFGMLANIALMANVVLIVAVLSLFQATLTLPGIAGIVLTVGMAVDANVLIFERIREELSLGNTPHASINAGYDKAYSTILDANVTTLIAAIVLFTFGTGPVKGFATTLTIGIATSMFTAIMGTRAIVNLMIGSKKKIKKLSI